MRRGYLCSTDTSVTLALLLILIDASLNSVVKNVFLGNWRNLPSHSAYLKSVYLAVTCWCDPMWSYNYGLCWRYWEPTQDFFV